MHTEPHPQRGEVIPVLVRGELYDFEIEDWWDRVSPRFADEAGEMVYGRVLDPSGRPPLSKIIYNGDLQPRGMS